jgi:hypothetical protein
MIKTAYIPKPGEVKQWRAEVVDTINECIRRTESSEKKYGLRRLVNDIFTLVTDSEIAHVINKAIHQPPEYGYQVNTHNNPFDFGDTKTTRQLRGLLSHPSLAGSYFMRRHA